MSRELAKMIDSAEGIVFFGGAGVSTESGIPDFRGEGGRFRAIREFGHEPEELLSHGFFMRKPDAFYSYYKACMLNVEAKPNDAHMALAQLERLGKLRAVITQNIDGLHQLAGSQTVIELHGSIYRNHCVRCGKPYDVWHIKSGEGVPKCVCGGTIKPDVTLYGEQLDHQSLRRAAEYIAGADMLIVGGTSLAVYPAAGLIEYYSGEKLALINRGKTPYDNRANIVIDGYIGEVMRGVMNYLNGKETEDDI